MRTIILFTYVILTQGPGPRIVSKDSVPRRVNKHLSVNKAAFQNFLCCVCSKRSQKIISNMPSWALGMKNIFEYPEIKIQWHQFFLETLIQRWHTVVPSRIKAKGFFCKKSTKNSLVFSFLRESSVFQNETTGRRFFCVPVTKVHSVIFPCYLQWKKLSCNRQNSVSHKVRFHFNPKIQLV